MKTPPNPNEYATRYDQACACCGTWVNLLHGARGGHHARTHVDTDTGAEVRLVWCARCVDNDLDPLLIALVDNDNAPEDDQAAAARMWDLHAQIHKRVAQKAVENRRDAFTALGSKFGILAMAMAAPDAEFTPLSLPALSAQAADLRATFYVGKNCWMRTHTFRGEGIAWGMRAKVLPAPCRAR